MTAVVDIATLGATGRALRAAPADSADAMRKRLRSRLRTQLRRALRAYIGVPARSERGGDRRGARGGVPRGRGGTDARCRGTAGGVAPAHGHRSGRARRPARRAPGPVAAGAPDPLCPARRGRLARPPRFGGTGCGRGQESRQDVAAGASTIARCLLPCAAGRRQGGHAHDRARPRRGPEILVAFLQRLLDTLHRLPADGSDNIPASISRLVHGAKLDWEGPEAGTRRLA